MLNKTEYIHTTRGDTCSKKVIKINARLRKKGTIYNIICNRSYIIPYITHNVISGEKLSNGNLMFFTETLRNKPCIIFIGDDLVYTEKYNRKTRKQHLKNTLSVCARAAIQFNIVSTNNAVEDFTNLGFEL